MEPLHISLIIASLACLSSGVLLGMGWRRYKRSQLWQETEGIIVTIGPVGADESQPVTFSYRTTYGEEKTVTSRAQTLAHSEGSAVKVLYNPDQPDEAVIDSFAQRGKLFMVIGAGVFVIDMAAAVLVYYLLG